MLLLLVCVYFIFFLYVPDALESLTISNLFAYLCILFFKMFLFLILIKSSR